MTPEAIATLVEPYIGSAGHAEWPRIYAQLATYLELILKWNAKTNLTAVRQPDEIVRRHFGESLFAGAHLGECEDLLDFGSGAGFPGLPIQLLRPDLPVTLAESQGKKAAFLREVVRMLALSAEVYSGRVEAMAAGKQFHTVALRAVDNMEAAVREAGKRASQQVVILGTLPASLAEIVTPDFELSERVPLPGSDKGVLEILHRR